MSATTYGGRDCKVGRVGIDEVFIDVIVIVLVEHVEQQMRNKTGNESIEFETL